MNPCGMGSVCRAIHFLDLHLAVVATGEVTRLDTDHPEVKILLLQLWRNRYPAPGPVVGQPNGWPLNAGDWPEFETELDETAALLWWISPDDLAALKADIAETSSDNERGWEEWKRDAGGSEVQR